MRANAEPGARQRRRRDRSASTDYSRSLAEILPALERFTRFEGPDGAREARRSGGARWTGRCPRTGEGREAVLEALR